MINLIKLSILGALTSNFFIFFFTDFNKSILFVSNYLIFMGGIFLFFHNLNRLQLLAEKVNRKSTQLFEINDSLTSRNSSLEKSRYEWKIRAISAEENLIKAVKKWTT